MVFNISFYTFLYVADIIPVVEVTVMVPSFPQESWTSKSTEASSLPGDVVLVWEFIDFMILSKSVYASSLQRLKSKSSLDIFFLLEIFAKKFSSCRFGSCLLGLDIEFSLSFFFFFFFCGADLRMSLGLLEYCDLYYQFV